MGFLRRLGNPAEGGAVETSRGVSGIDACRGREYSIFASNALKAIRALVDPARSPPGCPPR